MTKRIYSYYDLTELADLETAAKELGMTISSYQKYATLLLLYRDEAKRSSKVTLPQLIVSMQTVLSGLPSGQTFIISALFPPETWTNLSAADKRKLAGKLKQIVVDNPTAYRIVSDIRGKIHKYEKL